MIPAAYRPLLAMREARVPLVGATIGRLPLGAAGLALILLVKAKTGSFAEAGIVEAGLTIGAGVGLPIQGRIIDRTGQTVMLMVSQTVSTVVIVALIVSVHQDAPLAVMTAFAFAWGAFVPPLSLCMRGLWSALLEEGPLRQSAYALDAVVIEVAFVLGPLITAVTVALASPTAAVAVSAGLEIFGTLLFAASAASRSWRGQGGATHWAGPLRAPGIRLLTMTSLALGFAAGSLILGLTAFATEEGSRAAAGVLIAAQGGASLIGGLWYGARVWSIPLDRRYVIALGIFGVSFIPLVAAWSIASMAVLVILTGFALAPTSAIEYSLVDHVAPAGTTSEAFAWLITATVFGAGIGEAICGAIVNGGHIDLSLLISTAAALTAAGIALLRRGVLRESRTA